MSTKATMSASPGFSGIWSAMPTPLNADGSVDADSVPRLIDHHLRLGVSGLFLCGTAGEGPWLSDANRLRLIESVVRAAGKRLFISAQVTDNSSQRMIANVQAFAALGIDMPVIAPPFFCVNATQAFLEKTYHDVIEASPLPVGLYNRGKHSAVYLEPATFVRIARHPKVTIVKDSSGSDEFAQCLLALRRELAPRLSLFCGDEFACDRYIAMGYDGLLLGGACFNGRIAGDIFALAREGKPAEAAELQRRMNAMNYTAFGGEKIPCWLAGQKHLMVKLGVLANGATLLNYETTPECRQAIDELVEREKQYLLP